MFLYLYLNSFYILFVSKSGIMKQTEGIFLIPMCIAGKVKIWKLKELTHVFRGQSIKNLDF